MINDDLHISKALQGIAIKQLIFQGWLLKNGYVNGNANKLLQMMFTEQVEEKISNSWI